MWGLTQFGLAVARTLYCIVRTVAHVVLVYLIYHLSSTDAACTGVHSMLFCLVNRLRTCLYVGAVNQIMEKPC